MKTHYIIKEGEAMIHLEYPTEKPNSRNYFPSERLDYEQDLKAWQESAVKTPFHKSQKEAAENLAFEIWEKLPDALPEYFQTHLSIGIPIPDGLVSKLEACCVHEDYNEKCEMDFGCKSCVGLKVFAFLKQAKPLDLKEAGKKADKIISKFTKEDFEKWNAEQAKPVEETEDFDAELFDLINTAHQELSRLSIPMEQYYPVSELLCKAKERIFKRK